MIRSGPLMDGAYHRSRSHRRALVETLRNDGHLRSARVAAALEAVPREIFVPGLSLDEVYRPSDAIVTKRLDGVNVSSASAPEVIALMLEQLDAQPGERVLEIGAGTGYNAALLAHLVGESGQVVTVDIDEDLVLGAREHLCQAGFANVIVAQTDGALGYPSDKPFDRIILTVASSDIAPAWRDQLRGPTARLVLPLSLRGPQRTVAFVPKADYLHGVSLRNCSFIPLRGALASSPSSVASYPNGARVITGTDEPPPLSFEAIDALMRGPSRALRTGVTATLWEIRMGLHLWLVTHQRGVCTLWGGPRVPDLFGTSDRLDAHGTLCVMDSSTLVLLARSEPSPGETELLVLAPTGGELLADHVRRLLQEWDAAGRLMDAHLQIRAYPRGAGPALEADEVAIDQRWSRFILRWQRNQPPAIFTE